GFTHPGIKLAPASTTVGIPLRVASICLAHPFHRSLNSSIIEANPPSICQVNADANSPATRAARTSHHELNQHRNHHTAPHLAPRHRLLAGVSTSGARLRIYEPCTSALASCARLKRKTLASSAALRASARILPPFGRHQRRAPTAGMM